jgi:hypothetical protein
MHSHQITDVITGKSTKYKLVPIDPVNQADLNTLARRIQDAEKFEFVSIPLEPARESDRYNVPDVNQDEMDAWNAGLLPLPAPLCWYEFRMVENLFSLLITSQPNRWKIQPLFMSKDEVMVDGITLSMEMINGKETILCGFDHSLSVQQQWLTENTDYMGYVGLALYLTLMVNSRSTVLTKVAPPAKLNKARLKRNATPLADHTVVRIVPDDYIRASREESGKQFSPPTTLALAAQSYPPLSIGQACSNCPDARW